MRPKILNSPVLPAGARAEGRAFHHTARAGGGLLPELVHDGRADCHLVLGRLGANLDEGKEEHEEKAQHG